jgi:hypothetical protein
MNNRTVLLLITLAMPAIAAAETPFAHPNNLPKISCDAFHYSRAYLQRYPMAPAACIEGRMLDGEKWAKFNTRVYLANFPKFITVEMLDVGGNPISTFSFRPAPGARIVMNGTSMSFSEVERGDLITFWKSEKRLDTHTMPPETAASWQALPPLHSRG